MANTKQKRQSALHLQIQEALKNRQNIELKGRSVAVKKLLNELISVIHGKLLIPRLHEEDYTIRIIDNISFPPSEKIFIEGLMRHIMQEFNWPALNQHRHLQFYFPRFMKEIHENRIMPVLLFERPEVLKKKALRVLDSLSEYSFERKSIGVPSIICMTERAKPSLSLHSTSLIFHIQSGITTEEISRLIESTSPGFSKVFEPEVIKELERLPSQSEITTKIKDLIRYMRKLGLEKIDSELYQELQIERKKRRIYAPATH